MRRILVLFLLPLAAMASKQAPFKSETGFPGAVTVEKCVMPTDSQPIGFATVTLPYLDINGKEKLGQGRCYFTKELLKQQHPLPVYVAAHYPIDRETAARLCEQGFLAVTPHTANHPLEFVLGNSINFMQALTQWARRQPLVDRTQMVIGGGSGGGYMTLVMGGEFFPVAALLSDLPCVNWAYGCNYLKVNQQPDPKHPMPVLSVITPGLPLATHLFGEDMTADTWLPLSPVSYVNRITAPTMMVAATGDMLCTFEQFTAKPFYQLDTALFPKGYNRDFEQVTLNKKSRLRFDQAVPKERLFMTAVTPPAGLNEYRTGDDMKLDRPLRSSDKTDLIDLPWSKEKQISFVVLNEGAPLPHLGHTRYSWNISSKSFLDYHINRPIGIDQLNAAKLQRLLERYSGALTEVATLANGKKANRLNFQNLERREVLAGLIDYTEVSKAHEKCLKSLYRKSNLKPFGKKVSIKCLQQLLNIETKGTK